MLGLKPKKYAVNKEHSGFIIDIKRPTRDGYVACLVITPKFLDNGSADVGAKVERNLSRAKAINLAIELLTACDVSTELITKIQALDLPDK